MDRRRYRPTVHWWSTFRLTGVALFLVAAAGCRMLGHGEWSASEFKEWYARFHSGRDSCPVYYQGSDETHHHFIARPIDSWMRVEIQKHEVQLALEFPYLGSSSPRGVFYQVDPDRDFALVQPVEGQ
jgi:hypothetical protein